MDIRDWFRWGFVLLGSVKTGMTIDRGKPAAHEALNQLPPARRVILLSRRSALVDSKHPRLQEVEAG